MQRTKSTMSNKIWYSLSMIWLIFSSDMIGLIKKKRVLCCASSVSLLGAGEKNVVVQMRGVSGI